MLQQTKLGVHPKYRVPQLPDTPLCGHLDGVTENDATLMINGWAFNADHPEVELPVFIVPDSGPAAQFPCNQPRRDVQKAGAPKDTLGFSIPYRKPVGARNIKIFLGENSAQYLLATYEFQQINLGQGVSPEAVVAAFALFFHRRPESDQTVFHQMEQQPDVPSMFENFFQSPEFLEKNANLLTALKSHRAD